MPISVWLRGPLRGCANALLNPEHLQCEGYLHPAPINHLWQEHCSCRFDHTTRLWPVLMWQAWLERGC